MNNKKNIKNIIHPPIRFNKDLAIHSAELEVEIEPIGKARPRVTARGKFAHAYTPKKTKDYELKIKNEYIKKYGYNNILKGPLEAEAYAYFSIPKSSTINEKSNMLNNIIKHTHKPDLANFDKAIFDALNGVAFEDDSQIVKLKSEKRYSDSPKVVLKLKEIKYDVNDINILEYNNKVDNTKRKIRSKK